MIAMNFPYPVLQPGLATAGLIKVLERGVSVLICGAQHLAASHYTLVISDRNMRPGLF